MNLNGEGGSLVKGRLPFRLGTTSYIYPAEIITNVRALQGLVDGSSRVFWS